jgi:hypothetical protein
MHSVFRTVFLLAAAIAACTAGVLSESTPKSDSNCDLLLVVNKGDQTLGIVDPESGLQLATVPVEGTTGGGHVQTALPDVPPPFTPYRERSVVKAGENYWGLQVEIQELAVRAWAALAESQKEDALRQMKSAAELEDGTEKSTVTPGPLAQFEATLTKEPGRFRALYGAARAAQLSGNRDASQRYFRELLKVCVRADNPGTSEIIEAGSQTALKPIIENDRVVVWEVTDSPPARAFDAVVVSLSGSAAFLPKGTHPKIAGRSIVIDLKDHPVAPIENTSGYPLAFPRRGMKKLLENERVVVWDYTWMLGVTIPMHFHDKDVVGLFLEDGDLKSTTPDGQAVVNSRTSGTVMFGLRNRTHTETLVRGKQRAILTELK